MEYQLKASKLLDKEDLTPVEQVLANRGIHPHDINHYFHTTTEDILQPELLDNIDAGAKMLIKHLAQGDKIFIQIDPDVDGFTAAATLLNYLNFLFPGTVQQNIIYRVQEGKQHGIILNTIPANVKMVIVPDAGSNQFEEHQALYEQGIDVLVLDHHEAEKVSEYACVINNQLSNYPDKNLSGVGIVYKFCQYLDKILNQSYANELVDLVAIGIISDMMDLKNFEVRQIISMGLSQIKNEFLKAFVKDQDHFLKDKITPFGVSFYIAPYINATVRMGSLEEKILLFEAMLNSKALEYIPSTKRKAKGEFETRVEQACRNCKNIKSRQTRARDTSLKMIEDIIEKNDLLSHPILIIQLDDPIEENLTGLIANYIMGKYHHPVLLLNKYIEINEETGEITKLAWRGSGRCPENSKLANLREFLANSNYVEYAQGHASAFGVSILEEQLDMFKKYIDNELKDFDFQSCYYVDFIWDTKMVESNIDTILKFGDLETIWGQGIAEPYVAIERVTVSAKNLFLMSPDQKPTLKITLPNNLSLIKFRSSQEEYKSLYSETGCVTINIVGTCKKNIYNGNISPQIQIEDYEIVNKTDFYF